MNQRQTPKCFRQVGRGPETEHLYIEDYAKSYLAKESGEDTEDCCVIALYGIVQNSGEVREWYIEGAARLEIHMEDISAGAAQQLREEMEDVRKHYFPSMKELGWFFRMSATLSEEELLYATLSREWFPNQEVCFLTYRLFDGMLHAYLASRDAFEELSGYYIYYEKNVPMQEYLVEHRIERKKQPEECSVAAIRARFREDSRKEEKVPTAIPQEKKPLFPWRKKPTKSKRSRLSIVTKLSVLTFLTLLLTFLCLQHNNMDEVAEAVQAFAKIISVE